VTEVATTEGLLLAVFVLNFASVFLAVWVMSVRERRRRRAVAMAILEQMGKQADTELAFMDIVTRNFDPPRGSEGGGL
jgi:hypothetical protein